MNVLYLILYILAAGCFVLSALGDRSTNADLNRRRLTFLPLGLLFWVLVPLIRHIDSM